MTRLVTVDDDGNLPDGAKIGLNNVVVAPETVAGQIITTDGAGGVVLVPDTWGPMVAAAEAAAQAVADTLTTTDAAVAGFVADAESATRQAIENLTAALRPTTALLTNGTTSGMQAYATNAAAPLVTPTADGSGITVHPTVVQVPGGVGGYEYWMAVTGYYNGDNAYENPHILASHDGLTWVVPAGLTNPIKPKGPGAGDFNSDTYITWHDGLLWLTYRSVELAHAPNSDRLYCRTSPDGVTWSAETLVLASNPTTRSVVSPCVLYWGGQWHMWGVDRINGNALLHWTSNALPTSANWSAPTTCTLTGKGTGMLPWHVDVCRDGGEWLMTAHMTTGGGSTAGGHLQRYVSTDGNAWVGDPRPMLAGNEGGLPWDQYMYRGCARPALVDGRAGYRLWYSALKGSTAWRSGHTFVQLRPRRATPADLPAALLPVDPYLLGDTVNRADAGAPGTATSGQAWAVDSGAVTVASRALTGTSGVASITLPVQDVEVGATIATVPSAGFTALLAAKKTGATTDYVLFGANGPNNLAVAVRVGNVTTEEFNLGRTLAAGDRITLRVSGGQATGALNGVQVFRVDVSGLAGFTGVGVRYAFGTTTPGALRDIYAVRA